MVFWYFWWIDDVIYYDFVVDWNVVFVVDCESVVLWVCGDCVLSLENCVMVEGC